MTTEQNQQTVAEAIWQWCGASPEDQVRERSRKRKRAAIEAAVGICVGLTLIGFRHQIPGTIVICIALLIALSGAFAPALYDTIKNAMTLFGKGVGILFSWVLLLPFFYLCFTTGRLFAAITRKDPLSRACPTDLPTYWSPRQPVEDKGQYRKQY